MSSSSSTTPYRSSPSKQLNSFLYLHRLGDTGAGGGGNNNTKPNVVCMRDAVLGIFAGSYNIPDAEYDKFLELYFRSVFEDGLSHCLCEAQDPESGPICIDLDVKVPLPASLLEQDPKFRPWAVQAAELRATGWNDAQIVLEKSRVDIERARVFPRRLDTARIRSFLLVLRKLLQEVRGSDGDGDDEQVEFVVTQRRFMRFDDFDATTEVGAQQQQQQVVADGAHIMLGLNSSTKVRTGLRELFLRSPLGQEWGRDVVASVPCSEESRNMPSAEVRRKLESVFDHTVAKGDAPWNMAFGHKARGRISYSPYEIAFQGTIHLGGDDDSFLHLLFDWNEGSVLARNDVQFQNRVFVDPRFLSVRKKGWPDWLRVSSAFRGGDGTGRQPPKRPRQPPVDSDSDSDSDSEAGTQRRNNNNNDNDSDSDSDSEAEGVGSGSGSGSGSSSSSNRGASVVDVEALLRSYARDSGGENAVRAALRGDAKRPGVLLVTPEMIFKRCKSVADVRALLDDFYATIKDDEMLREASAYTSMLDASYFDAGSREKRVRVCWALCNTSGYLLIVWILHVFRRQGIEHEFAERLEKYVGQWVESRTHSARSEGPRLQMASLKFWAKQCNLEGCEAIERSIFNVMMRRYIDDLYLEMFIRAEEEHTMVAGDGSGGGGGGRGGGRGGGGRGNKRMRIETTLGDFHIASLLCMLIGHMYVQVLPPCEKGGMKWFRFDSKTGIWREHPIGISIEISVTLANKFEAYYKELHEANMQLMTTATPSDEQRRKMGVNFAKMRIIAKIKTQLCDNPFKNRILSEAKVLFFRPNFISKLDMNTNLFSFSNGVFDFTGNVFREATPDDNVSLCCNNPYLESYDGTDATLTPEEERELRSNVQRLIARYRDSDAGIDQLKHKEPWVLFEALPNRMQGIAYEIKEYMSQMFSDPQTCAYMYLVMSMSLVGNTQLNQRGHILQGKGRNGKSIYADTLLRMLFGEYYFTLDVDYWISDTDGPDTPTPSLANGRGARILTSFEAKAGSCFRERAIKLHIGGTDTVTARGLFEKPIQFVPQYMVYIVTNHDIRFESYDYGVERRMAAVPVSSYFYESEPLRGSDGNLINIAQFKIDPNLNSRMTKWPTVFLWILTQLYVLSDGRLPPLAVVPEVRDKTSHFLKSHDILGRFLRFAVQRDHSTTFLSKSDLNGRYRQWFMEQMGCEPSRTFATALHSRISDMFLDGTHQEKENGWLGVSLRLGN